ncbi:hypothetical protein C7S16_6427 [Burkholderia thailandensis]|uniref:Uncharacterized protein n=1 Tax=Burkholderia thailandensis TaxID=57975 RepID=A0AAW9CX02_BURTH|nr:hypothetical protein [Burkholderia thailandensis]MDW9253633.1 hypothetical protein [Burkholderia thailandensis]
MPAPRGSLGGAPAGSASEAVDAEFEQTRLRNRLKRVFVLTPLGGVAWNF